MKANIVFYLTTRGVLTLPDEEKGKCSNKFSISLGLH